MCKPGLFFFPAIDFWNEVSKKINSNQQIEGPGGWRIKSTPPPTPASPQPGLINFVACHATRQKLEISRDGKGVVRSAIYHGAKSVTSHGFNTQRGGIAPSRSPGTRLGPTASPVGSDRCSGVICHRYCCSFKWLPICRIPFAYLKSIMSREISRWWLIVKRVGCKTCLITLLSQL